MQTELMTLTPISLDLDHSEQTASQPQTEWVTPDFDEQSTCAEICAYVFQA
jgi:hypothetical protein